VTTARDQRRSVSRHVVIGHFHLTGLLAGFLLVVTGLATWPAHSTEEPVNAAVADSIGESRPNAQQHHDIKLAELLDENGHIVLPEGFSGSIDPAGFQMVSQEGEAPRFVRSGNTNDQWSEGEFGVPGCSGSVVAATVINGELFLGGNIFTACGFAATSSVARFDPTTGEFAALGDGVNGAVNALAAIGEDLYVGGTFDQAGSTSANHVAVYDTTQSGNTGWSTLGDGVNSWVHALAAIGDDLYVGGSFSQAGGAAASRIAVFDTTQTGNAGWSALGDGVNGWVFALAAIADDLYVGGGFSQAGGASISRLAVYDTTQNGNSGWSALGDGVNNGQVNALVAIDDDLYVGGLFSQAGSAPANSIAVYDTTQTGNAGWSALGDGMNNAVQALAAIGDDLYVGGNFSQAGDSAANRIAVFDTTQTGNAGWSALGDGVNNTVYALAAIGDDLYVEGGFSQAGGAAANRIAVFDTTQTGNAGWSALGDGVNNIVFALAAIGDDLYVGGSFLQAGGAAASRIAVFDTTQTGNAGWSALGDGVNSTVEAMAAIGDDLYVGGSFLQAGGAAANRIAVFDTNQTGNAGWSALGDGVNSTVQALAAIGDDLYVGGQFTQAGGAAASRIAVFDTTQTGNAGWSAIGDGVNSTVWTLAAIGDDLYVGGFFSQAGGAAANQIAVFDTTQTGNAGWSALGDGVNGQVRALAAIGDDLYVGGLFTQAGGATANRIAVFDTTQTGNAGWSALGDGVDSTVHALAAIDDDLYVGGQFTQAGGAATNQIAVFDTTQTGNTGWSALDDGVNSVVRALTAVSDDLYVGGFFNLAGGNVNGHFARYRTNQPPVAQPDSVTSDEDSVLNGDVLADNGNGPDFDPDGDPLSVTAVNGAPGDVDTQITLATGALLTVNANGSFSYDPNGQFEHLASGESTTDSFDYTISDGLATDSATVTVTINGVNDAPEANTTTTTTDEDVAVTITLTGSDIDGDALTFDIATAPANGSLGAISQLTDTTAEVTYTPDADFNGSDSFTFTVNDGTVDSTAATVDITIDPVNDAPEADDTAATTDEDTAVTITLTGSDVDGDALTFAVAAGPADGSLGAISQLTDTTAEVTYTPDADFNGSDSFTFTVNDGTVDSAAATVEITINRVNDAPEADDTAATTDEDTAVTITLTGSDVDGDALTFAVAAGPTNGSLGAIMQLTDTTAEVTYTPDPDFNGSDSFTFTVNDGTVDSNPASVDITVNPVNDPPSFTSGPDQSVIEDAGPQIVTGWATDIQAGPANESDQTLTFNVTANSNPALFSDGPAIDSSGTLTYTPAADTTGTATITIELTDDGGTANGGADTSDPATFEISVTAEADLAIAKSAHGTTVAGELGIMYTITITNNGPSDVDGARVIDTPSPELTSLSWTCAATGQAQCSNADGSGAIDEFVDISEDDSIVFTLTGMLPALADEPIDNTATVESNSEIDDPDLSNNSASASFTVDIFSDRFEATNGN
jgi:trimeric autotransporter adhesin